MQLWELVDESMQGLVLSLKPQVHDTSCEETVDVKIPYNLSLSVYIHICIHTFFFKGDQEDGFPNLESWGRVNGFLLFKVRMNV